MIPKIIHYIWFGGGKYPSVVKKCMASWKKYLPEYEFVLWSEDNFDVTCNRYVQQAHQSNKWAFVSDYVRLHALYKYGGIYLDTDVEVLRGFDDFLGHQAFTGFENEQFIPTGVMGAQQENRWIKLLLDYYNERNFILADGSFDMTTNVSIITALSGECGFVPKNGYQVLDFDVHIYPSEYFCPLNKNYSLKLTQNTYAIHHFAGSWLPAKIKFRNSIARFMGENAFNAIRKCALLKHFYSKM